jgi:2-oxoglutarate dehydrogenase E2 component (dihydrolipoamide succinyltransferase)
MKVQVTIPQLGESIVEATVGHWLKKVGDPVQAGEPVVEIETDKVTMEVTSPQAGVLAEILRQEGDTAQVGEAVAVVDTEASTPMAPAVTPESAAMPPAAAQPPSAAMPPAAAQPPSAAPAAPADASPPSPPTAAGAAVPTAREAMRPSAPPSVRRLAKQYGVDLASVAGSVGHGQVTREDVVRAWQRSQASPSAPAPAEAPGKAPPPPAAPAAPAVPAAREERVRMSRRRLTIARQLVSAQHTAAMLTTFNEVDMTNILTLRRERQEAFQREHGVRLGFMSFFVAAVVGALKKFPRLNAEIQGEDMILKHHYDIGIAVATEEGLVVPVLRDADRLSLAEIERRIAELAERARSGRLTLEDLRGGTFTITNGGVFGSLFSTPILNPPQVGILGMHAVQERPVAKDGQVVVRPMMYVALSYDHRIVDGSEAVRFLVTVKQLLEDPVRLLLEG